MKEHYIQYVIDEYVRDGNFDEVFGSDWIDQTQVEGYRQIVCDHAFAQYGIDAGGKYATEVGNLFDRLLNDGAIRKNGDDYAGYWFRLDVQKKNKHVDAALTTNLAGKRIRSLGDYGEEALRRALNQIVEEDDLRSMLDKWAEVDTQEEAADEIAGGDPADPNKQFFEDEKRIEEFQSLATEEIENVRASDLTNSQKAQATGYLQAAKALSEVPEPPVDLIWDILSRANSLAGIGSFFIALITLVALAA